MENFEFATRSGMRWASIKGQLNVEQLWDLPLESANGFNLDAVARSADAELQASSDKSFVKIKTQTDTKLVVALDIVKHIIATKLAEQAQAFESAARKQQREKLHGLIANKQDEVLRTKSVAELQAELAALSD